MAGSYLGDVRAMSFNFAPQGWAACKGQLLPVAQNRQLLQLIGTTYGGGGVESFALPNSTGPESGGTPLNISIALFGDLPAGA